MKEKQGREIGNVEQDTPSLCFWYGWNKCLVSFFVAMLFILSSCMHRDCYFTTTVNCLFLLAFYGLCFLSWQQRANFQERPSESHFLSA
jgi:hypothetical protein